MLVEQGPDGPVLKLKHFHPGLIGWEEKDQVFSYPLVKYDKNLAVLERPDKLTRLTYRRTGDSLSVSLERTVEAQLTVDNFVFKLSR